MIIGILQFELLIPDPESLKDKRRVVRSVKDRLHRDFQCAVAEVGALDNMAVARMGVAVVSGDGKHAGQMLDHITERLRSLPDAHLGDCRRELISGRGGDAEAEAEPMDEAALDQELLDRALQDPQLAALVDAERRAGESERGGPPDGGLP